MVTQQADTIVKFASGDKLQLIKVEQPHFPTKKIPYNVHVFTVLLLAALPHCL